ncbi:hypothetical protein M758_6G198900 [Ceratodon purpureus]|nr:hypothetical protein M758_6G198900 [Ceratodon purpureus]
MEIQLSAHTNMLLAVLVVLCCSVPGAWSQGQSGFLYIDCGSTTSYVDPITGIYWLPDSDYIPELSGQNHQNLLITDSTFSDLSELKTLRAFDDLRAKNCYALPVKKNSTYLLRASFYYGNYDNTAKPPTFQVSVEATIVDNITTSSTELVYTELYYISQSNVTFLCLLPDASKSTPFISAINLRPVDNLYKTFDEFLGQQKYMTTRTRVDFGGSALIRYPKDFDDRYWHPEGATSSYLRSTTTPVLALGAFARITDESTFWPPSTVMQTAVATSGNLTSYMLPPGSATYANSAFLLLHFAELDPSASNTSREFYIDIGDGREPTLMNPYTDSKTPGPYSRTSWLFWDRTIGPTTLLTLYPTAVSLRGPILNAMEVFSVPDTRHASTLDRDVLAIENIKATMNLTEWTGDPCLPYPHPWVQCNTSGTVLTPPKIVAVILSGYKLKGPISPSFADLLDLTNLSLDHNELTGPLPDLSPLVQLKTLHLEDNYLSGPLPGWLTSLPLLRELTVQNNNFSGAVPAGLLSSNMLFKSCPGNQFLDDGCKENIPTSSNSLNLGAVIGVTVGGLLFALIIILIGVFFGYRCYKRRQQEGRPAASASLQELGITDSSAKPFALAVLAAATNNFTKEIGRGGFGPVYHGTLPDGKEMAVKVADESTRQGEHEFVNEVLLLSRVHHKNLVELLGYCQEKNNQILVYEYLRNGSLHDQLHGIPKPTQTLNWRMRLNIALNAAEGLEYLHTGCTPSIIHRDVKSSNILLTGPGQAEVSKMSDFGLSRTGPQHDATHVSTIVRGTAGYLDPQYFGTQKLSLKSDVFSFGVVILELLTGRLPIDKTRPNREEWNICDYVRDTLGSGANIDKILDPDVRASRPKPESLWRAAEVALRSVEPKAVHRPNMVEVIEELRAAIAIEDSPGGSSHHRPGGSNFRSSNPASMSSIIFYESDNMPAPR